MTGAPDRFGYFGGLRALGRISALTVGKLVSLVNRRLSLIGHLRKLAEKPKPPCKKGNTKIMTPGSAVGR